MIARTLSGMVLLLGMTFVSQANAEIAPIAQLRQLAASGTIVTLDENLDFYDSIVAEDFGVFDDSTGLALRTEFGTATADGFARQISEITPTGMTLFASADAFAFTISGDDSSFAGAASLFSVRFTVDTPTLFRLQASGFAQNNATSYLRLSDVDFEPLVEFDAPTQDSIDQEIFLPAGEYGLAVDVTANGYIEFGNGLPDGRSEMTASLTQVPEPASVVLFSTGLVGVLLVYRRCRARNQD